MAAKQYVAPGPRGGVVINDAANIQFVAPGGSLVVIEDGGLVPSGVGAQVFTGFSQALVGVEKFRPAGAQTFSGFSQALVTPAPIGSVVQVFTGISQALAASEKYSVSITTTFSGFSQALAVKFPATSHQIFSGISQAAAASWHLPDAPGNYALPVPAVGLIYRFMVRRPEYQLSIAQSEFPTIRDAGLLADGSLLYSQIPGSSIELRAVKTGLKAAAWVVTNKTGQWFLL